MDGGSIAPSLRSHEQRLQSIDGATRVVEFEGKPVARVINSWDRVVEKAGLSTEVRSARRSGTRCGCDFLVSARGVPIGKVSE
jgi:hypothetical protein